MGHPFGMDVLGSQRHQYQLGPRCGAGLYSQASFGYPAVVDFDGNIYQTTSATEFISEGLGTSACTACFSANSVGWAAVGTYSGPSPQAAYSGSETYGSPAFSTQQFAVFTAEAVSDAEGIYEVNYTSPQTLTSNLPPGPLPVGLGESGYNAGGLTNIESTFWIRERTYVAEMPTANVSGIQYPVTCSESGLPTGTEWWVNVTGGASHSSTSRTLAFNESNGTYTYTLGSANKTLVGPSGAFVVSGDPALVPVVFSLFTYPMNFTEIGLPAGTGWLLNVVGAPLTFVAIPTATLNLSNGTYSYTASSSNATYSSPPGSFRVAGRAASVVVGFNLLAFAIEFSEGGLPGRHQLVGGDLGRPIGQLDDRESVGRRDERHLRVLVLGFRPTVCGPVRGRSDLGRVDLGQRDLFARDLPDYLRRERVAENDPVVAECFGQLTGLHVLELPHAHGAQRNLFVLRLPTEPDVYRAERLVHRRRGIDVRGRDLSACHVHRDLYGDRASGSDGLVGDPGRQAAPRDREH